MRPASPRRAPAALLLLALAGAGCATLPSGPPLPDGEVRALADRMAPLPSAAAWQVALEGSVAGGGREAPFTAYLLLAPGRARLEVPGEMGSTLFLAVDDGDRSWTAGEALGEGIPLPARLAPLYDLWGGRLPRGAAGPLHSLLLPDGEQEVSTPLGHPFPEGRVSYRWRAGALASVAWREGAGTLTLEFLLGHPWRLTLAGNGVTAVARVTEAVAAERAPPGAFAPPEGAEGPR